MQLESSPPVYRKFLIPWYDSDFSCFATIAFMCPIFLFGLAGIFVAYEHAEYKDHMGVPMFLVLASLGLIFSTAIRLLKRYAYKFKAGETGEF